MKAPWNLVIMLHMQDVIKMALPFTGFVSVTRVNEVSLRVLESAAYVLLYEKGKL